MSDCQNPECVQLREHLSAPEAIRFEMFKAAIEEIEQLKGLLREARPLVHIRAWNFNLKCEDQGVLARVDRAIDWKSGE